MQPGLTPRLQRNPRVRCRDEGGGRHLLFNPETDELHLVGDAELAVFRAADGPDIDNALARFLEGTAPDERTAATAYFFRCVREFTGRGLLRIG